jgi:hypothetical protein
MRGDQAGADGAPLAELSAGPGRRTPTLAAALERDVARAPAPRRSGSSIGGPRQTWLAAALLAGALVVIGVSAFRLARSGHGRAGLDAGASAASGVAPEPTVAPLDPAGAPRSEDTVKISIRALPSHSAIAIDGVEVGHGHYTAHYPIDGRTRIVQVSAEGHETREIEVKSAPIDEVVQLSPIVELATDAAAVTAEAVGSQARPPRADEESAVETGRRAAERTRASSARASQPPALPASPSLIDSSPPPAPAAPPAASRERESEWPRRRTDNRDPWRPR